MIVRRLSFTANPLTEKKCLTWDNIAHTLLEFFLYYWMRRRYSTARWNNFLSLSFRFNNVCIVELIVSISFTSYILCATFSYTSVRFKNQRLSLYQDENNVRYWVRTWRTLLSDKWCMKYAFLWDTIFLCTVHDIIVHFINFVALVKVLLIEYGLNIISNIIL